MTQSVHNCYVGEKAASSSGSKKRRTFGKIGGAAIGSAMAGVDGAVFRNAPPPHEVVEHNRHPGSFATRDGTLIITLPEDVAVEPADG